MPWIDSEFCIGCGLCVAECPGNTISMIDGKASIDMEGCIRCGICHSVCPKKAVKHDSEKIPEEVASNIEYSKELMAACAEHLGSAEEGQKCLNRLIKHYNKDKTVAERTLQELMALRESPENQ